MAQTFLINNGDIIIDQSTGRPLLIEGSQKTKQDFREFLSIETQDSGFGAGIVDLVGFVPENPLAVSYRVMKLIEDGVGRWVGLQRKIRAILTDAEVVKELTFNQATVDETNFTTVLFRAAIKTRAGNEVVQGGTITTLSGT